MVNKKLVLSQEELAEKKRDQDLKDGLGYLANGEWLAIPYRPLWLVTGRNVLPWDRIQRADTFERMTVLQVETLAYAAVVARYQDLYERNVDNWNQIRDKYHDARYELFLRLYMLAHQRTAREAMG